MKPIDFHTFYRAQKENDTLTKKLVTCGPSCCVEKNNATNLGLVKRIQDSNWLFQIAPTKIIVVFLFLGDGGSSNMRHCFSSVPVPFRVLKFSLWLSLSARFFFTKWPDSSRHVQCHKPALYENRGATNSIEYELLYYLRCQDVIGWIASENPYPWWNKASYFTRNGSMQNLGFCCREKNIKNPTFSFTVKGRPGAKRNHFQALTLDPFPVEINDTPSLEASEQWQATHQRHSSKY